MKRAYFIVVLIGGLFLTACDATDHKAKKANTDSLKDLGFELNSPGKVAVPLKLDSLAQNGWTFGGMHGENMEEFYLVSTLKTDIRPRVVSFRKEDRAWKRYKFYANGSDTLYDRSFYIERTEAGWSKMKSLGAPFDSLPIMRLTASSKGTLVFDEWTSDGNGQLRYARLVNGKWETPKPFGPEINGGKWTAHPFIAADESYLIWDSEREGGYGDSDMYISFRQADGSWGTAINFGDAINTDGEDGGGYVTPDGKYLSFCPRCQPPFDRLWMDAEIIEELRTK